VFRRCVCLGIIDIGIVYCLCNVYLLVYGLEMVFFYGVKTAECYIYARRNATCTTDGMLHVRQTECYMYDSRMLHVRQQNAT
jgi:hypothetical protein